MNYHCLSSGDIEWAIRQTEDESGPIQITLSPGTYELEEWPLPRNSRMVHINGQGAAVQFKKNGFHARPHGQSDALNRGTATRYLVENFASVVGGDYGVNIGGTFNSVVRNIEFVTQRQAAVELRFALMSRVESVLATNPMKYGIRVLDGDWHKSTNTNSQSNHTVLSQCRVYAAEGGMYSFDIANSNGVRLLDCISEGRTNQRAVNYYAKGCNTAKHFHIDNFHLEHAPMEGGIAIAADAGSSNLVERLYVSSTGIRYPIRLAFNGPVQLKNIGWWDSLWRIYCKHRAPRATVEQCHYRLNRGTFTTDDPLGMYYSNIHFVNPLPA